MLYLISSFFLAAICNFLMDLSSEGRLKPSLNKANSWLNKWRLEDGKLIETKGKVWYYFGLVNPKYVERFPYSSTLLVSFTDLWHLMKTLMFTILKLGACLSQDLGIQESIILYILLTIAFWIGFYPYKLFKWK